jgi:hypothetical protein
MHKYAVALGLMVVTNEILEIGKWSLAQRWIVSIPVMLQEMFLYLKKTTNLMAIGNFDVMSDRLSVHRVCMEVKNSLQII